MQSVKQDDWIFLHANRLFIILSKKT